MQRSCLLLSKTRKCHYLQSQCNHTTNAAFASFALDFWLSVNFVCIVRDEWLIFVKADWINKEKKMFRLNHQPYNNLLFFCVFLFMLFVHIRYFQFSHKTIQSRNNKPSLLIKYDFYLSCSLSWARLLLSLTKVPQWKVSSISFLKNFQCYVGLKTSKLCFMFM